FEVGVLGWGLNNETWDLDYRVIDADPSRLQEYEKLKPFTVDREFTRADGVKLRVSCMTIDSGTFTQEVYRFCFENRGQRIFPTKGGSDPTRPIVGKPSAAGRPAVKLFIVGTEAAKDTFFSNLRLLDHGPGFCHFPFERQAEEFALAPAMGRVYYDA